LCGAETGYQSEDADGDGDCQLIRGLMTPSTVWGRLMNAAEERGMLPPGWELGMRQLQVEDPLAPLGTSAVNVLA
jgi:hypothetical protein